MASLFGKRVKEALLQQGLEQKELAKKLNVTAGAVSHWMTGRRDCPEDVIAKIAQLLRVDAQWLATGKSGGIEEVEQPGHDEPSWGFPAPIRGQRDFGNSNVWTVPADIRTLVREAIQNSKDAAREGDPGIVMRFRIIELTGDAKAQFLAAMKFDELKVHIESATEQRGKLPRKLRGGLKRVTGDRLVLLRIDDFGTKGLGGPEEGEGPFAALVRNNLDSQKQSTTAGGSFGLGKAALWRCSDLSTVLFSSIPADTRELRVIGKSELSYHEVGGDPFAGPGWFGAATESELQASIRGDHAHARRLYLERDDLPPELGDRVEPQLGTSILIVAFQNPAAEEGEAADPAKLAKELEAAVAENFWPAIKQRTLAVLVERYEGNEVRSRQLVDPSQYVPCLWATLESHLRGDVVETLDAFGDVARQSVAFKVPKCISDRSSEFIKHLAVDAHAVLLVRLADPENDRDTFGANKIALVRGAQMVTQYLGATPTVGARPFHAVLLAGEGADSSVESRFAEQFLRTAEPPAHDKWEYTDDIRENYERGARTRLRELLDEVRKAVQKLVRAPSIDQSDGPDELKRLLSIGFVRPSGRGDEPLPPGPEPDATLRNVNAWFADGVWNVRADVVLKHPDRAARVTPLFALNVESGSPVPVQFESFKVVAGKASSRKGVVNVPKGTRRITITGTTAGSVLGIDGSRCTARLTLATELVEQEAE